MQDQNESYNQVINKESPLKEWLVDYVGEQHNPENDEVRWNDCRINGKEFPEFVFALAEENFLRGYEQAFVDMQSVTANVISEKSRECE